MRSSDWSDGGAVHRPIWVMPPGVPTRRVWAEPDVSGVAVMTSTEGPRQLLAYSFPPRSQFEGQLVGALQRIESGGALRILDALFVGREADSGELIAVSLSADGAAGLTGRLLSFRLEPSARAKATERALEGSAGP